MSHSDSDRSSTDTARRNISGSSTLRLGRHEESYALHWCRPRPAASSICSGRPNPKSSKGVEAQGESVPSTIKVEIAPRWTRLCGTSSPLSTRRSNCWSTTRCCRCSGSPATIRSTGTSPGRRRNRSPSNDSGAGQTSFWDSGYQIVGSRTPGTRQPAVGGCTPRRPAAAPGYGTQD
jgi:hypothetical protein